jgi:hypothetical protein
MSHMFNAYGVRGCLLILINVKREVRKVYYKLCDFQQSLFIPLKGGRHKQFEAFLLLFHALFFPLGSGSPYISTGGVEEYRTSYDASFVMAQEATYCTAHLVQYVFSSRRICYVQAVTYFSFPG